MSKKEWEKSPGFACVCVCVCVCVWLCLFSPTQATNHSYSSAEEPAVGKSSKIRKKEKKFLTKGTVSQELWGISSTFLSSGHQTQEADIVELCNRVGKGKFQA